MHALVIEGGRRLAGTVDVPGSKNSALSILSAVLLAEGPVTLHHIPNIADVRAKSRLLEGFGAKVRWEGDRLHVDSSRLTDGAIDPEAARSIRTSFFLMGPLLARLGRAILPGPGGCRIGARPVDFHLKGLAALGATIDQDSGHYLAHTDGLRGTDIYLDYASPGATQHLMIAAARAKGVTTIQNAAMEPEVDALSQFLNRLGARIEGAGTATITITGVDRLGGGEFRVPPDRIQAGTYLLAGAITGGDVTAKGLLPDSQTPVVNKLREAGAEVEVGHDCIRVAAPHRLKGVKVRTMPYPGFPTDMQQPMCALLSLCSGTSIVEETVYESRIGHIRELVRMGAHIELTDRTTVISGVPRLQGATVEATDLRAGAALVLAGLAAEGTTTIRQIQHIDRGYERLEETLIGLGGSIRRVNVKDSVEAAT